MKTNFSEAEKLKLIELYPNNYTSHIAKIIGRSYSSILNHARKLGLQKTSEFLKFKKEEQIKYLKDSSTRHRYAKGKIPANKGKKMSAEQYEKCKKTMFKKGNIPHNAKDVYEEVLRSDKNGFSYWMIKLPGEKKLRYKHIWLWESTYGKVEKGYNVVFKDKNSLNCTLENLEYICDAQLMFRNTIHRFPEELKSTIRLVAKLKKQIHAKEQN